MSRNILNEGRIFINTITGGEAINISSTNSTSSTCNLKISKQTANTSIADTDLFVLETAAGDIKKITGSNMKSENSNWTYNSSTTTLYPDNTGDKVVIGATSITAGYTFQNMGDSYLVGDTRIKIDGSTSQVANNPLICSKSLIVKDGTAGAGFIKFFEDEDNGTNNLQLIAPASIASDCVLNLPSFTGTETLALSSSVPNLTTAENFGTALSRTDPDTLNVGTGGNSSGVGTTTNIDGYKINIGELVATGGGNSGSLGSSEITIQATQYYDGNPKIHITAQAAAGVVNTGAEVNITSKKVGSGADTAKITMVADTEIIMNTGFKINSSGAITALGAVLTNNLIDTGIADNKLVEIDSSTVVDNDYAKFTANGLEGRSYSEVKTDLSLNNVENTALSTFTGSTSITTLGTIATGVWNATAIAANYGGTGFQTYTIGDILYANTTTTLTKLNVGSANTFLMSNGSNPLWGLGYSFTNPLNITGTTVNLGNLSGWGSNNQILATNGSDAIEYRTLTAGTGITIGNTSSTITITGSSVYWKRNTNIGSFDIETTTDVDNIDITVPFSSSSYLKATSGFTNGAATESLKYVDYVSGGVTIKVLEIFNTLNGSVATQLKFLHNSSGSNYPVIKTDTNADFIIHHENSGDRFVVSKDWDFGNAHATICYDNSAYTYIYDPSGVNAAKSRQGAYMSWHNNGTALYLNTPAGGTSAGDYIGFSTHGSSAEIPKGRMEMTGNFKITGTLTQSHTFSDERVKENIKDYDTNAVELLNKLKIKSFDRRTFDNLRAGEDGILLPFAERFSDKTYPDIGLIAQDILKDVPELNWLVENQDGGDIEPMTIPEWSPLTAICIKAIQEQKEQIDNLTALVQNQQLVINNLLSATTFANCKKM